MAPAREWDRPQCGRRVTGADGDGDEVGRGAWDDSQVWVDWEPNFCGWAKIVGRCGVEWEILVLQMGREELGLGLDWGPFFEFSYPCCLRVVLE